MDDTEAIATDAAEDAGIDIIKLQTELRHAIIHLQQRYMLHSAKWCAELLNDITSNTDTSAVQEDTDDSTHIPVPSNSILLGLSYMQCHEYQRCVWALRTKSTLTTTTPTTPTKHAHHTAAHSTYLRLYATYLSYQQRCEYAASKTKTAADVAELQSVLTELYESILFYTQHHTTAATDADADTTDTVHIDLACMWYLYALVCKDLSNNSSLIDDANSTNTYMTYARISCIYSINHYPYNWSCWRLLAGLCNTNDIMLQCCINGIRTHNTKLPIHRNSSDMSDSDSTVVLNEHFLRHFWLADVLIDLQEGKSGAQSGGDDESGQLTANSIIVQLADTFPTSTYLLQQSAVAHYQQLNYDLSQQLFEQLREVDPYRFDAMDVYSNILYVKELKAPLSYLAHVAHKYYKYTPIACVIIGNYYSLQRDHVQAIQFFKRAIQLDSTCTDAYTLLGHEYIELKKTSAAIEAYRLAVRINSRDYRAWYGLGQTYELLQLPTYALYYFRRAVALRSFDARMWVALAQAYINVNNDDSAIKCYLRADANNDKEGVAVYRLAKLLKKRNDAATAAHYYKKVILYHQQQRDEAEGGGQIGVYDEDGADVEAVAADIVLTPESIESMQYLAEYSKSQAVHYTTEQNFVQATREYGTAEAYCNRLLDCGGTVKDSAKALLMEIRQLKTYNNTQSTNSSFHQKQNMTGSFF